MSSVKHGQTKPVACRCGDTVPSFTINAPSFYALGMTPVTFMATDASGNNSSATAVTTVQDTTAPTLVVTVTPTFLSPPNHKYVSITLAIAASVICDPSLTVTASVQSSEPDDSTGGGDGQTTGDIRVTTPGGEIRLSSNAAPQVVFDPINDQLALRAERQGSGMDRTYSLTITATDASRNQTATTVTVTVPHTQ